MDEAFRSQNISKMKDLSYVGWFGVDNMVISNSSLDIYQPSATTEKIPVTILSQVTTSDSPAWTLPWTLFDPCPAWSIKKQVNTKCMRELCSRDGRVLNSYPAATGQRTCFCVHALSFVLSLTHCAPVNCRIKCAVGVQVDI